MRAAFHHGHAAKRAEHTRNVAGFRVLRGMVRVEVCRAHEARWRVHVAGQPAHAGTCAVGRELCIAPAHRARHTGRHVHVAAQVLQMPCKTGLVCQYVGGVAHHLQPFGRGFHHDAAVRVGDDPVQQAYGEVPQALVHQRDVRQRGLDVVDGVEVRGNPQGELVRCHGGGVGTGGIGEMGVAGKVQPGYGQAVFVGAVEVQRVAVRDDGHAQHGAMPCVGGVVARGERDGFAVAIRPVQVAAKIQVAVRVGESNCRAHEVPPCGLRGRRQACRRRICMCRRVWYANSAAQAARFCFRKRDVAKPLR